MKNIFLGLIFGKWIPACPSGLLPLVEGAGIMIVLVLLPQASFAVNSQKDAQAVAFFDQQAQERAVFIKTHPDLITKQDNQGKWLMAKKDAQNSKSGITFSEPAPPSLTTEEEGIFAAFVQKQQSDKDAFFQKLAQEK